ncbi:hypothetical protein CEE44_01095 [Candidatus Woesearchaeota archaeon B3_Woes]|nr:MAG: hypothetical protein CEE44_01095 [Candidatus Woesearchaeota archaeon B3_Woes]
MAFMINFLLFALSCLVLLVSGSFLIKSLSKIAAFLRMSKFVVSFIIVGMATSLPELFVGISSALAGQPEISLGNVIGSNIANLTIILGIPLLLARGIAIKSKTVRKDSLYMFGISLLPLILMAIGESLSKLDGIILIVFFLFYSALLIKQKKKFTKPIDNHIGRSEIVGNVFLFIVSALFLYYSAKFTVKYASLISIDLALPPIFVGLFIIALGTSLPELVVGFHALKKNQEDIILGNIMGSVVANSTLVLGVTALIFPITTNLVIFFTSISFMILASFLFMIFIEAGKKIYWKEGVILIIIYVLFIMVQSYIKNLLVI